MIHATIFITFLVRMFIGQLYHTFVNQLALVRTVTKANDYDLDPPCCC